MRLLVTPVDTAHTPESLTASFGGEPGVVLLRTGLFESPQARYSLLAARPFLTFRSYGARCELREGRPLRVQYGNPWRLLEGLLARFELLEAWDLPFPLGGCFGYWGYDLKAFVEPRLPQRAIGDLALPDCHLGFYDSLVVFDHLLGKTWVVATGLAPDGSRDTRRTQTQFEFWCRRLAEGVPVRSLHSRPARLMRPSAVVRSNLTRDEFVQRVQRAQAYIRAGDIYQVNLSQRLVAPLAGGGWDLFQSLAGVSPAPFAAYLQAGDFQIVSSSPELFLRLSGAQILTRPIKGTRPRSSDPTRDAQLTYELQTSPKETAELVMITDLLRNDLGRVCEFGSVHVPELMRLERYSQVQHLVSTVAGRLRPEFTHLAALMACFPGGSITGAPKFRAMEIIDELEPTCRGPYTGALGYLGFNRESQLSILIRSTICRPGQVFFQVGAGIVADSEPEAEYDETMAKGQGFREALAALPGAAGRARSIARGDCR